MATPDPSPPDDALWDRLPVAKAEVVSGLLRVVAHPGRLRILCLLVEGERSVGDIESALGLRQPSLSQQLGELREAGLVTTRRAHKVVFYTLTDERTVALLAALHDIFCADRPKRAAAMMAGGTRRSDQAASFATVGPRP